MILKPQPKDLRVIGYYLGRIIIALGFFKFIPLIVGIFLGEVNPTLDFAIGSLFSFIIGLILINLFYTKADLNWMQGMVVVSLTWLVAMLLGAIPLYLSGHWKSYLDSCFDAMSGYATTGLTLVQDLDHLSYSHNLWRHFMMFVGGQGIVVVALSLLRGGFSGALRMYVGEAREEKILPNVIQTARFIWLVSIIYLVLGTLSLGIAGIIEGMSPKNSFFHGACIFMAAFDTGGFAPQSQNILYYHSLGFEILTIIFMFLGAMNFNLHYALWTGNKREIFKNIEIITFFITVLGIYSLVGFDLTRLNVYPGRITLFRKGFYQLISGHTGTGYATIYAKQFIREWPQLALVGITIAMGLGGGICSTTGAIKSLRIGILFKGIFQDTKRLMLPESAIVFEKFHHIKDVFLGDKQVRGALIILVCYLGLYLLGAIIGMFFGYPFLDSLFESTSAAGNVGLSCGITKITMPIPLKITYIFEMWAGRLEFISVFTLIGFLIAAIRGK